MQTTLLGLAIAVILALLAALLGPYFVDWNQYRQTFEAEATRLVGLPVRVTGQIDARLLPSPSLIVSGIEIGKRGDDQLLRARALGIEFGLGQLVRGELRAVDMRVIAPEFAAGIDREGHVALPNMAVGFNLGALSVERLRVEDARLVLTDAASGTRSVVEKLWFGGEMRSLAGPFKGEGAFIWSGGLYGYRVAAARPDESGSRIRFSIDPSDRPLAVEGEGNLAIDRGVPRFEGSVTLARPVGAVLAGGATSLNEPWRLSARVKADSSSALLEQVEFQYGPEERALKLGGTAEVKFGANPRLEGVVSARQIDLDRVAGASDGSRRNPVAALRNLVETFGGVLRSPLPVQIGIGIDSVTLGGGTIQNLRGDFAGEGGSVTLSALEFRAPGFTQVQASGRLDIQNYSFTGPVDVSSVDPRALLGWLEGRAEAAGGAAKPMRARGDVTLGGGTIAVERLKAELDRKPLEGGLAYSFARDNRKARLDAQLKAEEFDIDGMLDFASAAFAGVKVERPGEMSLALDIGRGQFAGLEAKQVNARLTYDATGLAIERLSIGDFGGMTIDAKGKIDTTASSPRGSVTLDLAGRDLSGVAALAAKFAPRSAEIAGRLAGKLAPAKLRVALDVDEASERGQSVAKLSVTGNAGGLSVGISNQVTGTLADAAKVRIDLQGRIGAEDTTALFQLAGIDGVVAPDRMVGGIQFTAQGPLDGDVKVDARILTTSLQARSGGTMRLSAQDGFEGKLDLAVTKADLRGLRIAGSEESLPVTFSARASLAGQNVKLDGVTAEIAGVAVKGQLGFTLNRLMNIDGELETGAVDGAALIAAAAGMKAQRDRTPWPSEPFAQGLISDVNGRIALRVARADMAPNVVATNLRSNLRLAPAQLALENIEGDLFGGRLAGELSLRKAPEGLTARGRIAIKGADASQAMAGEGSSPVAGRVGLNVELEGSGLSPRALIGSLNGAGTVTLEGGRIAGLDAKAFGAAMRAVDQGMTLEAARIREIVNPALEAGPLVVPSADGTLTVSAGQARLGTLVARAEGADLAISGNYDLSDRSIDARIVLAGPMAITSAGRPELGIVLRGPAASPKRTLDVSSLAGWLALRSVEQQSRKLEAIERGAALPAPDATPWMQGVPSSTSSTGAATDQAPARLRPAAPREQLAPLPPPIDIKPAAGDRKSAPRVESELTRPRIEERLRSPARPPQGFEPRDPASSGL